jgi:histidinol phosphatase-like PHP family hydrolase
MFDFHTHTILSDGELVPSELVQRAFSIGYEAIGLTDHVDFSNIEWVLNGEKKAKVLEEDMEIEVIIGVEITHVPPRKIDRLVSKARSLGAEIIIVHGETLIEPVAEGTNLSAVKSDIDILAHPGLIKREEAGIASENDVYLEITSHNGHNMTNGHVARIGMEEDAKLILNTDTHSPDDLLREDLALKFAIGAGLKEEEAEIVINKNPRELLKKIKE